jgi:hypothetical protein
MKENIDMFAYILPEAKYYLAEKFLAETREDRNLAYACAAANRRLLKEADYKQIESDKRYGVMNYSPTANA